MNLQFIGGAYHGRSDDVNTQLCINAFVEQDQYDTSKRTLVGSPGLELFTTAGSGPIRGMHVFDGKLWVVSGNTFYEVTTAGTATSKGTLTSSSGPVQMENNGVNDGNEIMIVAGTDGYVWDNAGSSFAAHPSGTFYGANTIAYQDGYLLFNRPNTREFGITALDDATTIVSYQATEGRTDNLVAVFSDHRMVWLMGELSSEIWWNSGDDDFPFEHFQGGFTERGCAAAQSIARVGNTVMWLATTDRGTSQIVAAADGYRSSNITPPQIGYQIDQMTTISDARAFAYLDEGHEFYQITFPTEDKTYVFDASTKEWHQRSSSLNTGNVKQHMASCYAHFNGDHVIGSYQDGKIYKMKNGVYNEDGDELIRERIGPHIRAEHIPLRFSEVEMLMESGVGNISGDGTDPVVSLRWSKDGGHTWSSWVERAVGQQGQYNLRQIWRKLGYSRDWVFHLRYSEETKFILHDAVGSVKRFPNRGRARGGE